MKGSRRRQSAWVAFGLLAVLGAAYWAGTSAFAQAPAGQEPQAAVSLQSRALSVPPDRGQALRAVCDIPPGLRRHVIVQLDRTPTAQEREELEQ
ncbi:MAG: hypothetical protein H6Q28_1628, partial [Bacteroidetes bacterium]|nr:hypothetical protein [Bacteroidota bacterium]